ncbi:nucleotide exchange factor GrpE [Chlorobium sp. N1]|uniref:nucleotide exchange factor GrpE n=1 Tax=Chlorobium sp. N1 TaxID=2491138 RepID=UPI00103965FE|nr:nucleotide exchange factor GrpE [Chlorobium sp. N1]TCD48646.1 nucleotide exchange factor GrpE [Chlorobium sp. N1]
MMKKEEPLQEQETQLNRQEAEGQPEEPAAQAPDPKVAELQAELRAEKEQTGKFRDELLRRAADFENFRKQKEREAVMASQRATENILRDLLPILDDVERVLANPPAPEEITPAAKSYIDGVELIKKNLDRWLESKGVRPIEAVGTKLDVDFHEAISQMEHPDAEAETIIEQYQTGYMLGERVLRHAKVIVAR